MRRSTSELTVCYLFIKKTAPDYQLFPTTTNTQYNNQFNYKTGQFQGIQTGEGYAKARFIVGDPTYFPDRVKKVGQVARTICLMDRPVEATKQQSCQIIIPYSQVKPVRKHDIHIIQLSEVHKVVPSGKYLAIVSTVAETSNPEKELEPGVNLLGRGVIEKFTSVTNLYQVCYLLCFVVWLSMTCLK